MMWLGYLPTPPQRLEILIRFDKAINLGGIKIWNYNKSIRDSTKCVNELKIMLNDTIMWTGSLQKGKGQINLDYATAIVLKSNAEPGFALPQEEIPESTPQQTSSASVAAMGQPPMQNSNNAKSMHQLGILETNTQDDT